MFDLSRIKSDCFWDYDFSDNELSAIAKDGSEAEKRFLFAKILEHSTDVLNDLDIFSLVDKKALLTEYKPNSFNRGFIQQRYDVLRHFVLGDKAIVKGLAWRL